MLKKGNEKRSIIIAGIVLGILSVLLVKMGNPANMGFCIICFIRDTAGALGLHQAAPVQYIRPEIIGIALGAFIISLINKEYRVRGGSAPFLRFVLGVLVTVGALMFLGCPLRMILRLAGGDMNAFLGLFGLAFGIFIGSLFLKKGFSLKRNYPLLKSEGYLFPIIQLFLLILLLAKPAFISFSSSGPGSQFAPILVSLAAGLIVGAFAQRTRLCLTGGIRDVILFKDYQLIIGFGAIFLTTLIGNIIVGSFNLSFASQPVAHVDGLWNFLGMTLCGWAAMFLGGCPLRQIILSAEGNIDSVISLAGMYVGAGFVHNFQLASSAAGPTPNGRFAVILGLLVVAIVGFINIGLGQKKLKGDV